MTEDRARILRMVAEGTISPEEGTDLLEAVDPPAEEVHPRMQFPPQPIAHPLTSRSLVLEIIADGDTKVNLRVPIGLAMNNRFLPRRAQEYLDQHGIDLQGLVAEFAGVDGKGTLLEIEDCDDRVYIGIK